MIERDDDGSGTRVDLGDDLLLEKTRVIVRGEGAEAEAQTKALPVTPTDLLQNAHILLSEGFLEEAKRALHRVLIQDSSSAEARALLAEIHAKELKQIFGEVDEARPRYGRSEATLADARGEGERAGDRLEEDFQFSFVEETEGLRKFAETIEAHLHGTSPRDRLDLGIAFLEMGVYLVAEKLFTSVLADEQAGRPAAALLAYTQIRAENYYGAIATIQPVIHDSEIADADKTEFFYLLGRAHEGLGQAQAAQRCYQQVIERDSDYRDVRLRLRK